MNDYLTEAINLTDLPGLVAELYPETGATAGKAGAYQAVWRGDQNPSFSLYRSKSRIWMWKDFATGDEGNAFHFLTKIAEMSNQEAAHKLIARAGLDPSVPAPKSKAKLRAPEEKGPESCEAIPVPLESLEDHEWLDLGLADCLAGRGFNDADVERYGFRMDGEDAQFPIFDPNGIIVAVKKKHKRGKIRYSYPTPGHGTPAWCSPGFLDSRRVLVVEGELNGMIAHSVILENGGGWAIMAASGANGNLHLAALEGKEVYIYADGDDVGRKAVARWAADIKMAGAKTINTLEPFDEDFCDIAGGKGRAKLYGLLAERCNNSNQFYGILDREIGYYTVRELREIAKRYLEGAIINPTGFPELDNYTGGLPESGIVLVCGLPSIGKSVLMRDMVLNNLDADPDAKGMIFSPDQSVSSMAKLIASRFCNIPAWRVRSGQYTPDIINLYGDEKKARQAWQDAYDYVIADYCQKRLFLSEEDYLPEIKNEVEKALDRGVTIFAGDYIQIFEMETESGQEIDGKAIKEFKKHVRRWKVPFVFATQLAKYKFPLSRKSGIPISNDIEGSGKIFQAAEQCYMIYNYDIYTDEYSEENISDSSLEYMKRGSRYVPKARIYVRKNKEGKRNDFRYLLWDAEVPRFRNLNEAVITPGGAMKGSTSYEGF